MLFTSTTKTFVTHSERFHCDEVCAVAWLSFIHPTYEVIRTRDKDKLLTYKADPSVIVIDVGMECSPHADNYDHHQTSFEDKWSVDAVTPLSSFGLIYRHFSTQVFAHFLKEMELSDTELDLIKLTNSFYKRFVMSIDAHDNGIDPFSEDVSSVTNYRSTTLGEIVSGHNCLDVHSDEQDTRFAEAVELCKKVISRFVKNQILFQVEYQKTWSALQTFDMGNPKENILVLDEAYNHLHSVLKEVDPNQTAKLIVHPSGQKWKVSTVNKKGGARFENLVNLLPESMARTYLGDDLIFVHKARFVGAATTKEAAITLAKRSIWFEDLQKAEKAAEKEGWWPWLQEMARRICYLEF